MVMGLVEALPLAQLYVPTSLIAHAWPVQAQVESLRRQYLAT